MDARRPPGDSRGPEGVPDVEAVEDQCLTTTGMIISVSMPLRPLRDVELQPTCVSWAGLNQAVA
jgi:hypothetical protein